MNRKHLFTAGGAATVAGLAILGAWGPLDPPNGPIASTYKTLTEIEPRIAVNAANTPGDAGALFRITKPGSYYLTGNITGVSGKVGIAITASQVTLDLGGFALLGVDGVLEGVVATGFTSTVIRNGHITNWSVGVDAANDMRIEDILVTLNDGDGIQAPFSAVITRCNARNNGGRGFLVFSDSVITDCASRGAGGVGFDIGPDSRIVNCIATDGGATGILMGLQSSAQGCVASGNAGPGFYAAESSTITDCTANSNAGDGFEAVARTRFTRCIARDNARGFRLAEGNSVVECTSSSNFASGIIITGNANTVERCTSHENSGPGIWLESGVGNNIDGNLATYNGMQGIRVSSSDNLIVRNRARGNSGGNYEIDPASDYGLILTNPGEGFTSSAAWANFAY
jgi:parallel beta-helix repeat protein